MVIYYQDCSMSQERDEEDTSKPSQKDPRNQFEDDLLKEEESELDALVDSLLDEGDASLGDATERALRYAMAEDRESKASLFRMRSGDVTEEHLNQPKPEAKNVEDDWVDPEKQVANNRFFVTSGAIILLVIAACVIWAAIELRLGDDVAVQKEQVMLKHQRQGLQDEKKAEDAVLKLQEMAARYLAAETLEEKLSTVRLPDKAKPLMMDYYSRHKLVPENLLGIENISSFESDYRIYWVVTCEVEGTDIPRLLVMSQSDDDQFAVVWEVDVVYQPMEWEDFIKQQPTEAKTFRVYVEGAARAGFYGYDFADYSKYRCFELRVEGSDRMLWGYTEIGSEADKALVAQFRKQAADKAFQDMMHGYPMMLGLRYLPDSMSDRCVLIDSFEGGDWKLD